MPSDEHSRFVSRRLRIAVFLVVGITVTSCRAHQDRIKMSARENTPHLSLELSFQPSGQGKVTAWLVNPLSSVLRVALTQQDAPELRLTTDDGNELPARVTRPPIVQDVPQSVVRSIPAGGRYELASYALGVAPDRGSYVLSATSQRYAFEKTYGKVQPGRYLLSGEMQLGDLPDRTWTGTVRSRPVALLLPTPPREEGDEMSGTFEGRRYRDILGAIAAEIEELGKRYPQLEAFRADEYAAGKEILYAHNARPNRSIRAGWRRGFPEPRKGGVVVWIRFLTDRESSRTQDQFLPAKIGEMNVPVYVFEGPETRPVTREIEAILERHGWKKPKPRIPPSKHTASFESLAKKRIAIRKAIAYQPHPKIFLEVEERARIVADAIELSAHLSNATSSPQKVVVFPVHDVAPFVFRVIPDANIQPKQEEGVALPPPAPPAPMQFVIPPETRIRFEWREPLHNYTYRSREGIRVEWKFYYWNDYRPTGEVPVD